MWNRTRLALVVTVALAASVIGVAASLEPHAAAQADCAAPEGVEGCWQVDFVDEFDGVDLDPAAWEPGWFVDEGWSVSVNQRENACYHTDQVTVAGGRLRIQLDVTADPACLDKQGEVATLVGGVVSARDARTDPDHPVRLDDGFYIESRVRIPASGGEVVNWPAFWTAGFGPWPVTGEIDIAEGLGGESKYNYHYACGGGHCQVGGRAHAPESADGDWHTYGALRTMPTTNAPAQITIFFDGEPVATISEDVVTAPHYVIFSYTSHESNTPLATGEALEVDWVRSWSPTDPIRGDVSCSAGVNIVDALMIAQYAALLRTPTESCPLADQASQLHAPSGDVNGDERINVVDALIVAQCITGAGNPAC